MKTMQLDGDKDELVGKIQETYGVTRMEAQERVSDWADEPLEGATGRR